MKPAPLKAFFLVFALIALAACTGMNTRAASDPPPATGSGQAETYENPNYYYLFDDILVPNGMEHKTDEDFSFDTTQFKAGIQIFEGRVVYDDLVNFFQNNMLKDGWRKVSAVRSKKSILIFEKSNKAATIELIDGFKARATIFALEFKSGTSVPSVRSSARPGTAPGRSQGSNGSKGSFSEKDISN